MSKELLKSTSVVGGMTLISRVLGFVRDVVAAHFFGAGLGNDAFIVASKIPNYMRRLFAEGAFSQAFVPILSEYRTQKTQVEVEQFVGRVFGCLSTILAGVTILGILAAPLLVMLFAPGFAATGSGARLMLASDMLRITFPYLFFISLTAFAGGILNCYGRFAAPAFTPVFLNIMMILTTVILAPHLSEPVTALAWGMFAGGVVQLLFQVPFLRRLKLLPRPEFYWQDPGVRRILKLMLPALLGVSVNQLNLMLSSVFASFLPVGSVSWLYYAERLMEFPLGGFGVALATVVLPRLSRHHTKAENEHFSSTLDWGVRWVMLIGLPAATGLALLAGPLLTTLFQSGQFTDQDVISSQTCLVAYSLGIMGFMLVKIFASAYYAKQDVKTPVRMAVVTVIANLLFSLIFMTFLAHTGLALATSMAALLNATLLGYGLFKRHIYKLQPGWGFLAVQLLLALSAMGVVILTFSPALDVWFAMPVIERIITLFELIVSSGLAYIATLFLAGLRTNHILGRAMSEGDA
ncbi:MAG: murein biosynthesis integral membrane protein MurJ [Gammaproteobacteria bacterium]|nr:murein biosynthesis integral membrane protein MurJ [Gammaproteobacteria bacterium]